MIIYSSTEPCTMCAGALYWIGCRCIVFGCSVTALGQHTSKSFLVPIRQSLAAVQSEIIIKGPVLETDGEQIHEKFWKHIGVKK